MPVGRRFRRIILSLTLYLLFCSVAGIFIAEGALHPARRPLTHEADSDMRQIARNLHSDLEDVSITTPDGVTLWAWDIRPPAPNGDSVVLLHGLADNRIGMTGYARLLLNRGFSVLLPDARAHGASGGQIATYGLLERNDIRQWVSWLEARDHPHCIFGFGESMGAAQLLQSLDAGAHFCTVGAESPFSNFREIAYDRLGQPSISDLGSVEPCSARSQKPLSCIRAGDTNSKCKTFLPKTRWDSASFQCF